MLDEFEIALSQITSPTFSDNLGDYSEEQGKRFHQDIKPNLQRNGAPISRKVR